MNNSLSVWPAYLFHCRMLRSVLRGVPTILALLVPPMFCAAAFGAPSATPSAPPAGVLSRAPNSVRYVVAARGGLPLRDPQTVGLVTERLAPADAIVADAVANKGIPGAVLLVARRGAVVWRKAHGFAALRPQTRPMTTDTIFDLASLTKPVVATAAARLIEDGKIELDAPVGRYLPAFDKAGGDKALITVRHLMTHAGGLVAGGAYSGKQRTVAQIVDDIVASKQKSAPGEAFLYSDFSFVTMGAVVEAVTGETLDAFCRRTLFEPLGMKDTAFRPEPALALRVAATTAGDDTETTRGVVHDPTARALGGVSGNAGLFSTADDLAIFCQMLLNGGEYGGRRILKPETVALLTSKQSPFEGNARALGWDLESGYAVRGNLSPGSFGHTGFTGTSMWIDPKTQMFVILLNNAVHGQPPTRAHIPLRRVVSNAVAAAIFGAPLLAAPAVSTTAAAPVSPSATTPAAPMNVAPVQTGLDILARENFARLEGKNVGIVCNHTATDAQGRHLVDLMFANKKINIVALFGPEHSIRGDVDDRIGDITDAKTGLKVYSLYDYKLPAAQRYRPTPEMLRGIDTLVFDIQDIGARYYTYIATLGYVMEEAAKANIKVVVLDRPNPIGGLLVEGPLLDPKLSGQFTAYHTMPISHGMTMGELALMYNAERKIGANVEVVKMAGWNRRMLFDETGLPWSNPSPNIRNMRQEILYPGVGFLEGLPLSVGRGTDTPFEILGAPWIDGVALAANLNARRLPGVTFVPVRFTPTSSKHKGVVCGGVQIMLWERQNFRPSELGIHLADALIRLYPTQLPATLFGTARTMMGNEAVPAALLAGASPQSIIASWSRDVAVWRDRRAKFLLYP